MEYVVKVIGEVGGIPPTKDCRQNLVPGMEWKQKPSVHWWGQPRSDARVGSNIRVPAVLSSDFVFFHQIGQLQGTLLSTVAACAPPASWGCRLGPLHAAC